MEMKYALQKPKEFFGILQFLESEIIKNIVEIGVWKGGTTVLWSKVVEKHGGRIIAIDIKKQKDNIFDKCKNVTFIEDDSSCQSTVNFVKQQFKHIDLLMIDGDHSYNGIARDFKIYAPLVKKDGFIVFHDIIDSAERRKNKCFVGQFWNEIKNKYFHIEFIDPTFASSTRAPVETMGIGLLQK